MALADVPAAVVGAQAMGVRGFHRTILYKVAIAGLLESIRLGDASILTLTSRSDGGEVRKPVI
jgi:hypothetical protein